VKRVFSFSLAGYLFEFIPGIISESLVRRILRDVGKSGNRIFPKITEQLDSISLFRENFLVVKDGFFEVLDRLFCTFISLSSIVSAI